MFLSDYFIGSKENDFWVVSLILSHNEHHLPFLQTLIIKLSVAFGVLSAALVYFYRKELANSLAQNLRPLYSLSFNKWYFDELYNNIFSKSFCGSQAIHLFFIVFKQLHKAHLQSLSLNS